MNPLLEAAKQIGEKGDDAEEKPQRTAPGENGIGSYERFMSSFGTPQRWAGRS